jgi:hypothetical protein
MGRIRRDGKRIRAGGGRTRNEDCCCECNCETDGPTADFSYELTDDDPCTFDFTDESVAGECGAIVAWAWYVEGEETPFSTSQNPTGIELDGDGPWEVTLTVTDSEGCEDSAVMTVVCCDCETDGPTAGFYPLQIDHSPCEVTFVNTSTPGACGAITGYFWDFGDGNTSTSEEPTHTYASNGPWTVTLTVTDAAGCEDAASGSITCAAATICCSCYPSTMPSQVEVTIAFSGGTCAFYAGTYILDRDSPTSCGYTLDLCSDPMLRFVLLASFDNTNGLTVTLSMSTSPSPAPCGVLSHIWRCSCPGVSGNCDNVDHDCNSVLTNNCGFLITSTCHVRAIH